MKQLGDLSACTLEWDHKLKRAERDQRSSDAWDVPRVRRELGALQRLKRELKSALREPDVDRTDALKCDFHRELDHCRELISALRLHDPDATIVADSQLLAGSRASTDPSPPRFSLSDSPSSADAEADPSLGLRAWRKVFSARVQTPPDVRARLVCYATVIYHFLLFIGSSLQGALLDTLPQAIRSDVLRPSSVVWLRDGSANDAWKELLLCLPPCVLQLLLQHRTHAHTFIRAAQHAPPLSAPALSLCALDLHARLNTLDCNSRPCAGAHRPGALSKAAQLSHNGLLLEPVTASTPLPATVDGCIRYKGGAPHSICSADCAGVVSGQMQACAACSTLAHRIPISFQQQVALPLE